MNILKKFLLAFLIIVVLASLFIFVKSRFFKIKKYEQTPVCVVKFDDAMNKIFESDEPITREYFDANFGEFFLIAENAISKKLDINSTSNNAHTPEIIRKIAKKLNFKYGNDVEIFTSAIYVKNDNIKYSQRPYCVKIFAEYENQNLVDERYYANTSENHMLVTYNTMTNKIDFPISINGVSLWTLIMEYIENIPEKTSN